MAVTSPALQAATLGAVFAGLCGAMVWQGLTRQYRKPSAAVMITDVAVGTFAGYASKVLGTPALIALINWQFGTKITFTPTDDIGWVIVIAAVAGFLSSPMLRKTLDKFMPGWNKSDG